MLHNYRMGISWNNRMQEIDNAWRPRKKWAKAKIENNIK